MHCLLIAAAGAPWESEALRLIETEPNLVVVKRCVDITDLLGAATTGQADVALVALEAPGFDQVAVDHLRRHKVGIVAVDATPGDDDAGRFRAGRIGVDAVLSAAQIGDLAQRLPGLLAGERSGKQTPGTSFGHDAAAGSSGEVALGTDGMASNGVPLNRVAGDGSASDWTHDGATRDQTSSVVTAEPGRIVAVWGPTGAPGRTTVAVGLAGELHARGVPVTLVDADPYGGSVAQQLGVVEEVSGLLAATRLAAAGELRQGLPTVLREVAGIRLVSGLPRPDRWTEVRPGTVEHLVEQAALLGQVVIDTGFSVEDSGPGDYGTRPPRNSMTLGALAAADLIVVVGGADPVGLARLARALVELREIQPHTPVLVAVNRMRGSVGWSQRQVTDLIAGFVPAVDVHFLPDDRAAADRALLGGVPISGPVATALGALADAAWPDVPARAGGRGLLRRRTEGTSRRR